jgi:steroid 5-alpha reductase family enzyme
MALLPAIVAEGFDALFDLTSSYLHSSPFYVLVVLTVIAMFVCVPLTQYKTVYGDTVAYGFSVLLQTMIIRAVFPPEPNSLGDILTYAVIFWAIRLSVYLYVRDIMGWSRDSNVETRFKKLTVSIGLCAYYALVTIPLLYALRYPVKDPAYNPLVWSGVGLAWAGAILETVADSHKFSIKLYQKDLDKFEGPSTGVYRLSRHPNYGGEIVLWFGVWIASLPSICESITAAIASTIGFIMLCCILLFEASVRVEREQKRKYGGQIKYEKWKELVPVSVFPVAPLLAAFRFGSRV